jgi:hypothetical protein
MRDPRWRELLEFLATFLITLAAIAACVWLGFLLGSR